MEGPIDGTDWSVWHLDEESDGYPVGTPYYQNTVTQTMLWEKPAELLCHDNLHPQRASRSLVTISSPLSAACPLSLSAITVESMVRPHGVA
eukprot:COSAG04_NODE_11020_length_736_cov_1.169545_1_plen_91_part_00